MSRELNVEEINRAMTLSKRVSWIETDSRTDATLEVSVEALPQAFPNEFDVFDLSRSDVLAIIKKYCDRFTDVYTVESFNYKFYSRVIGEDGGDSVEIYASIHLAE